MNSNNEDYIKNNYQEKYNRKSEANDISKRKIKQYNTQRKKHGTNESPYPSDEYFEDHYYDNAKTNVQKNYYIRHKKSSNEENSLNNKQNVNFKNKFTKIKPDYTKNNNEIMRINTFNYFPEEIDKNNRRSESSTKKNNKLDNTLTMSNQNKSRIEGKRMKDMKRLELDNNSKNNDNLGFVNSNKNNSIKIINKTKSFLKSSTNDENREKVIKNNKRKNKNEEYMPENYLNYNYLNEKENKYNKNSTKIYNNNQLIKMSGFEISYESDKAERNSYNSYKRNRNKNHKNANYNYNFKYNNIYYSDINLEESNKNNYNSNSHTKDDNDIYNNSYTNKSNVNNQINYPYKYQIVHNNSTSNKNNLNNVGKKRININDSVEIKDLHNNKSVSIVSVNKKKNVKSVTNNNNTRPLKTNKSSISKNSENKVIISNNNSLDVGNQNISITKNDINTNISIENPIIFSNQSLINKKNSNNSFTNKQNSNSSRIKKKTGSNLPKKIHTKNYHKQSDIKKIILIQSVYRGHLLNVKLNEIFKIFNYYKELFQVLFRIFYKKKIEYWNLFLNKLSKSSTNRLINKAKNIKNSVKNKKNQNPIISTNNKLILKTNEINLLHKELGDSFNIINDNNGLKLKLDDMIKENNELKNQIFDNKNIEERLKQLLVENKKNQNINAIIMKDNQQLAKRLKNIQDNRNNQLVIQNQKSFDFAMEDNLQFQSIPKLKYLYLKCLIFKKILKNRNVLKSYFNKYRNNIKKKKTYKIENNNIFINNRKKINIQMAKNFNINFISQNDNIKHFLLYKLFLKKEKEKNELFSKFFYKYFYIIKCMKLVEEKAKKEEETKVIKDENEQKKNILQSLIDKYERNYRFLFKNVYREWKLRTVIFKMKGVAKEYKKRKKLKKKIRDKIAKETLNNLKNKTAMLQSAHEFSYKIDKTDNKSENNKLLKSEGNQIKEGSKMIKEKDEKNENNIEDQEDSEESFGLNG